MSPPVISASWAITRKARSNLAFALGILPRDRREDMVTFYAFCRVIDDLADNLGRPAEERRHALNHWREGLENGFAEPDNFQREVNCMRERRNLPPVLLTAIIDGCLMDMTPQRFANWQELSGYTWKVACAVGLVSIRIFGCNDAGAQQYAVALGHALQITNILRDVGEDIANEGRIYLPLEDLARFHYTEADLAAHVHDERFAALMEFEAERAEGYFQEAKASLPLADLRALRPAEIMREIYHSLLGKMRAGKFHVFDRRYRLSKAWKLAIFSKHLFARHTGSSE